MDARSCTCRSCSGRSARRWSMPRSPRTEPTMSRNCPMFSSVRNSFHIRQTGSEAPTRSSSASTNARSPTRIAAPSPNRRDSPDQPASRCVSAYTACVVDSPRRLERVVHHVVVEQGEGMHQFERRPCVDHALIVGGPSGADEAPLAERWAEALASGLDHSADLVERPGQVGVERCPAPALGGDEADHPVGDPRRDRRQARWRRGGGQPGNRHASADAGGPSRSAMTSSMRDRAAPMRCRHTSISVVALATRSASWSTSTSLASSSPRICSNSASALA